LEEAYGFKLFVRSNKKIQLTPEGQLLYEKFSKLLEGFDNAVEEARCLSSGLFGSCKLGLFMANTNIREVYELIKRFLKEYPQFDLELITLGYKQLRDDLISGEIDGIITKLEDVSPIAGYGTMTIARYRPVAVMSANHPALFNRDTITLADLAGCDFICVSPQISWGFYNLLINSCNAYSFEPNIVKQTESLQTLLLNITVKNYIAVLDESDIPGSNEMLRTFPIENIPPVPISLAWKKINDNPVLQAFIKFIKETFHMKFNTL